jgi:hypothetical protein
MESRNTFSVPQAEHLSIQFFCGTSGAVSIHAPQFTQQISPYSTDFALMA